MHADDHTTNTSLIAAELAERYGVLMTAADVADLLGATATSVMVRSRQPRSPADRALATARIHIGRRVYWRPGAVASIIAAAVAEAESAA